MSTNGRILDLNGRVQRPVLPPTAGTAADFYHRCAVAAATACNDETKTARELSMLAEVAGTSAMMRDLLTMRQPGRFSDNVTFTYLLTETVTANDCRGALLWLASTHEAAAREMETAGDVARVDPATGTVANTSSDSARQRAEVLRAWAALDGAQDEPRYDQHRCVALYATLVNNLLTHVLRAGPQLLQPCAWLAAELTVLATAQWVTTPDGATDQTEIAYWDFVDQRRRRDVSEEQAFCNVVRKLDHGVQTPESAGMSSFRSWSQDAPDHWSSVEDGLPNLSVWPTHGAQRERFGDWVWEVWALNHSSDDPTHSGFASDLEAAKRAAESTARRIATGPSLDSESFDGRRQAQQSTPANYADKG